MRDFLGRARCVSSNERIFADGWEVLADCEPLKAIYTALKQLGFKPYHLADAMQNPAKTVPFWMEALSATFEKGKPFGREEFDKLMPDHDVSHPFPFPS